MKSWLIKLKRKFRAWLLDEPYFMGVDWGFQESCICIVCRRKDGTIEVVSNTVKKTDLHQLEREIRELAKRYNIPKNSIVRDYPYGWKY